jgi:hypothetical protein
MKKVYMDHFLKAKAPTLAKNAYQSNLYLSVSTMIGKALAI